jgi:hypothetical protein
MASQQDSSSTTSPLEELPVEQPLADSPQDQALEADSPQDQEPLEQELLQESPEAPEVSQPSEEADPEQLLVDEPDPVNLDDASDQEPVEQPDEPEPEPEPEEADWLEAFKSNDDSKFAEMDLDWVPEGVSRDRARQVLAMADERLLAAEVRANSASNDAEIAKAAYMTEIAGVKRLIEQLDNDVTFEQTEEYRTVIGANQEMAGQTTKMAWQAFDMAYPGWQKAPMEQQKAFAEIVFGNEDSNTPPSLMTKQGETYFEKMESAWVYAAFQTKQSKPERFSGQTARRPSAPAARPEVQYQGPNDAQKAAAAIGAQGDPPSRPLRTVQDKSWDEILGEHDHLLADGS